MAAPMMALPAWRAPDPLDLQGAFKPIQNALLFNRQQAQAQQKKNALLEGLARTPGIGLAQAEALSQHPEMAGKVWAQHLDPMNAINRQKTEAEMGLIPLKRQQIEHGMRMDAARVDDTRRYHESQIGLNNAKRDAFTADRREASEAANAAEARRRYLLDNYEQRPDGNLMPRGPRQPLPSPDPGQGSGFSGGLNSFRGRQMNLGGPKPNDLYIEQPARRPFPGGVQVAEGPPSPPPRPSTVMDEQHRTDRDIQDYFTHKFGQLNKGEIYRRDGTVQKLALTAAERQGVTIAQDAIEAVRHAKQLLQNTGGVAEAFGFGVDLPLVGNVAPGRFVSKSAENAALGRQQMKSAIHDFLNVMSGKTVTDKERASYYDLYLPSATDTARQRELKMNRVEAFFNSVLKARTAGATPDDVSKMVLDELKNNPGSKMYGGQGKPVDLKSLSTDDLLKRLNSGR